MNVGVQGRSTTIVANYARNEYERAHGSKNSLTLSSTPRSAFIKRKGNKERAG